MNNFTNPLVSIGIPTYNQSEFLRQAIHSVLNQTLQDFEIIVIDDCSTDSTSEIVHQFDDPRIHYIRNDVNIRPPASWNQCIYNAKGKYFSILPHDDLYKPIFLEKMVSELESNPDIGFSQCAITFINENLSNICEKYISNNKFSSKGEEGLIIQSQHHLMNPASILFRYKSIVKHGPWDVNYWDDEVLTLKIAYHDGFIYLPMVLASIRDHPNNLSKILRNEDCDIILNVINQETAIFASVLPMTQNLLKLRSEWNRKLGYSCMFHSLKQLIKCRWVKAKVFFKRSIYLYPCVLIDPRLYLYAIKKALSRII